MTLESILEKTAPLFNRQGYKASADELRAAGVSEDALLEHFDTPEELADMAFDYNYQIVNENKFGELAYMDTGIAKVEGFLEAFIDVRAPDDQGYAIFNTVIQAEDKEGAMKTKAQRFFKAWVIELTTYLAEAQKQGALKEEVRPDALAMFLLSTIEGGLVASRVSAKTVDDLKLGIKTYLDSKRA